MRPVSESATAVMRLLATRRFCYFVPFDAFVPERGYRAAVVFEGESGYFPTGDGPFQAGAGPRIPLFWGPTYHDASAAADDMNARMCITKRLAIEIVTSSLAAKARGRRRVGAR